jgi:6-pyruvoyltetrahydropterin/6-carboxytetrahydropterin synthase
MKVAKQFRWEAAHRLPWHQGGCRHLHGHSYRMFVELTGPADERGLLVDFKELKAWMSPLVSAWDHATIVDERDVELLEVVREHGWNHAVLPYDTTAENLCRYAAEWLTEARKDRLRDLGVTRVVTRIAETETCYAEYEIELPA